MRTHRILHPSVVLEHMAPVVGNQEHPRGRDGFRRETGWLAILPRNCYYRTWLLPVDSLNFIFKETRVTDPLSLLDCRLRSQVVVGDYAKPPYSGGQIYWGEGG